MLNFDKEIVSNFSSLFDNYDYSDMNSEVINYYLENIEDSDNKHNSEIEGIKCMYSFICNNDINDKIDQNIVRTIHESLYSKVPFPQVGGRFRNHSVFIDQGNVELCPFNEINHLLSNLFIEIDELHKIGYFVKDNKNINDTLAYIDRCVKVLSKFIYICPFNDGNERVGRGIINKLFIDAGIAPVFVRSEDKQAYYNSIKKAIIQYDYTDINNFYLLKSCETMNLLSMNNSTITL